MSFGLFEKSSRQGKPVSLYEFTWGATIWRYTSADRSISHGGFTWEPVPISDDGYTIGPQSEPLTVKLPARLPLCQLFRSTPPSLSIWLRALRYHMSDPDQEAVVYWVGTVGNVKRLDAISAQIVGLPISGTMRRTGLRLCWERNCPHALYDQDCKADKNLFKTAAVISAINGAAITVSTLGAFTGPQYEGGFIEWAASAEGTLDRRGIESFVADTTFSLLGSTDRLAVGLAITLYLGCDLTAETCDGTFNNLPNHGGFRFLPGQTPFEGQQVF